MKNTAFSYKSGNSFLHKLPSWIKIIFIPILSIAVFQIPFGFALALLTLQTLVSFLLRFTLREQLADLRAVLYYAVFIFFAKIAGTLIAHFTSGTVILFNLEKETCYLLIKLLCIMQSASLIFKTSTSLQLREGLEFIEFKLRKFFHIKNAKYTPLAQTVSLFICFIPQISRNWNQAVLAWKSRGGKKSLKMIAVLLPVFISVGMKQAYNSARAISIRQKKIR